MVITKSDYRRFQDINGLHIYQFASVSSNKKKRHDHQLLADNCGTNFVFLSFLQSISHDPQTNVYAHVIGCVPNTCIWPLLFQLIKLIVFCLFDIFVLLLLLCCLVALALSLQVTGFSLKDNNKRNAKQKIRQNNTASAGNRTRVNCLEGSYAHHYTTDALVNCPSDNFGFIDHFVFIWGSKLME